MSMNEAALVRAAEHVRAVPPQARSRPNLPRGAPPAVTAAAPVALHPPAEPAAQPKGTSKPRHRIVRRRSPGRPALSQPTGPHIRLGILWCAVTLGALLAGPAWLTAWLALVAAMAAGSAARTWGTAVVVQRLPHNRRARVQPPAAVAALFAACITVAGLAGGLVVAVVAATVAVALVAAATFGPLGQPDGLRRVVIVLGPGLAASGLVMARAQGLAIGLVLAGMVTVFDSSAFLIGTGAPNRWEGSVAGVASIAALTLFVAAVLAPPFTGASPWLLGGAAALLAPVGPVVARWVTGDKDAPVPALRRLDSLFLVGPAWVAGVALVLHR
ncbi:MAG: hypothetical protein QOE57_3501 [Acidimicrobiaceae bacterium]|nr:hypothetical protein [Acidimicrobiaceae bacterium]